MFSVFPCQGQYNKASEYFQQAFDTTVELMNASLMEETQVHYGIAKAHQMMLAMNSYIESQNLSSLDYLLSWKECRRDTDLDLAVGKALILKSSFVSFLIVKSFSLEKFIPPLILIGLGVLFSVNSLLHEGWVYFCARLSLQCLREA